MSWGGPPRAVYGAPPAFSREPLSVPKLDDKQLSELRDRGPGWLRDHCALCGQFLIPRLNPWTRQTVDDIDLKQTCDCTGRAPLPEGDTDT
jgi:hypothetical protein